MTKIPHKTPTGVFCLSCGSPMHAADVEMCPQCSYSLRKADAVFGGGDVLFPRVLDEAGVLTHSERGALMRALERIERKLPPIALCVYLTRHGVAGQFCSHAHWILNHASLHKPSFGKREQLRIQDAPDSPTLMELSAEERRERATGKRKGWWERLCERWHNRQQKKLKAVQKEWMLILVLDVQLERACFSWGYRLDPYINQDSINSAIIRSRLHFRERAMVTAIKRVMTLAVRTIAADSHGINKSIRPAGSVISPRLAAISALALCGVGLLASPTTYAQPEFADDDDAVLVEEAPAAPAVPETPAPPAATPQPAAQPTITAAPYYRGNAAGYRTAPAWSSADYDRLMQRKIDACYNRLMPGGKETQATPLPQLPANTGPFGESDTVVPGHYTEEYLPRSGRALPDLNDPQLLMTDPERADARYVLEGLNAHCPFRIYVSIFKAGQHVPTDLAAPALVRNIARIDEYAVLLQYNMGDSPRVDLGLKSIELTDDERLALLAELQQLAVASGGGSEGLMAAMRYTKEKLLPKAASFVPLNAGSGDKLSSILEKNEALSAILKQGRKKEKEKSTREELLEMLFNPAYIPYAIAAGAALASLALLVILYIRHRRRGKLLETVPVYRLMSPAGAGVSRFVKYLEGKENAKPQNV